MFVEKSITDKEKNILRQIYCLNSTTRQQLLSQTNYTSPTVYRAIDNLIRSGFVVISGTEEEVAIGRPTELISINGRLGFAFCLNITRIGFNTALVDLAGQIRCIKYHLFYGQMEPEELVEQAFQDCIKMVSDLSVNQDDIVGIALAAVGPIDYQRGCMQGPILFMGGEWNDVPIVDLLKSRFKKNVEYDCNASACLMGHYLPTYYTQYGNMAYITLGSAIGSGLVLNHELHVRHNVINDGLAHMKIEMNGRKCNCGSFGCVEAYASKNAIVQECVRALKMGRNSVMSSKIETLDIDDIHEALICQDRLAESVLFEAASAFSCGLVNYLRIVDLEAVILGGSLVERIPFIYDMITSLIESKKNLSINLIKGENEDENVLRGIASEYFLNVMLK